MINFIFVLIEIEITFIMVDLKEIHQDESPNLFLKSHNNIERLG